MKKKIKNQWMQLAAIVSAAACVVTGTVAGVSGVFAPIDACAFEEGSEIELVKVKNTDSDGKPSEGYHLELADKITKADVGQKITVTLVTDGSASSMSGAIGYADSTTDTYDWTQTPWEVDIDKNDTATLSFEVVEGMVGQKVQIQCWWPKVETLVSYSAVCGDGSSETTTTTTTTTVTSDTEDSDITTTTTLTDETGETTTTTITTIPEEKGEEVKFTTGTQKGEEGDIQAVAEFEPGDAKYAEIVYKVSSDDLNSSGGIGTYNAKEDKWIQVEFDEKVGEDGLVKVRYIIPENVGKTVKVMVFYPGYREIEFKSITLFGSEPDFTVTTVTTKKPDPVGIKTVKVNNGDNQKVDINNIAFMRATFSSEASGTCYYNNTSVSWTASKDDSGKYVAGIPVKVAQGDYIANFQVSGGGSGTVELFYYGDASLNGVVNASDVRAIAKYLQSDRTTGRTDIMNAVCDYTRDGNVGMADAVTLTKALIGSSVVPGSAK